MKTIRFHLKALPAYTPGGADIFLAGNFNQWNPCDPACRFKREKDGSMALSIRSDQPTLEYKLTRGNWSTAEGDPAGYERPNRCHAIGAGKNEIWINVQSWADFRSQTASHTTSENVTLLHHAFFMPQTGRERRIWAYLPPDYQSGTRRYPVIYMQDGQNLFNSFGSFSGEWGVDKALNSMFWHNERTGLPSAAMGCIVIGIENGGSNRINEYSPWLNQEEGGGEGRLYLEFICNTLKPYIDRQLRTLPDRAQTGIMGSSMGGLISLYAAIERPDVFGMAGIFSPSLWFSTEILSHVRKQKSDVPVKILLMAGQRESKSMVSDLLDLYEALLESGHADENLHYDLHSDGDHSEWFWAREFGHAFEWLFGGMPGHRHGSVSDENIRFRLDASAKQLIVDIDHRLPNPVLEIRDYCHYREFHHTLQSADNRIPYAEWENCLYSIRLLSDGDLVFSRRVHLNSPEIKPIEN